MEFSLEIEFFETRFWHQQQHFEEEEEEGGVVVKILHWPIICDEDDQIPESSDINLGNERSAISSIFFLTPSNDRLW